MATELDQSYKPKEVETKWYKAWEESGCFEGDVKEDRDSFTIMIPPPLMENGAYNMNQTIINTIFPQLIPLVATANKVGLLDVCE